MVKNPRRFVATPRRGSGLLLETQHRIGSLLHANITRHHEGGLSLLSPFLCPHHRFMPSHWKDVDLKEHLMAPMQVDSPHSDFRYGPG